MGDNTSIGWTDATWNPVTGCTEASEGCDLCYAKRIAERFRGTPGHHYEQGFDVVLRPELLEQPLSWRRPRMIFTCSMGDLFHPRVPDTFIDQVFDVMERAPQHTFQVLTKRHARLRSYLSKRAEQRWAFAAQFDRGLVNVPANSPAAAAARRRALEPIPGHIWVGVSVESQRWADIRVPALLATPATTRFLSIEPLLEGVEMWRSACRHALQHKAERLASPHHRDCCIGAVGAIDWVIVGGESGPGARRMDLHWVEALVEECADAGVPLFMKQLGTVLSREWGLPGKGDDPNRWPLPLPREYPAA